MRWPSLTRSLKTLLTRSNVSSDTVDPALHILLGQRGEHLAADYLPRLGYTLVVSNFTLPVGRNLRGALVQAEIDLIAYEASTLCFIEVRPAPPTGSPLP